MKRLALLLAVCAAPVWAYDPSEILPDPAQEAIARALDQEIRCVKCQSEVIASSNADWARDARRAVRELVSEGKTHDEVLAFFVERYGEVVLMNPSAKGANLLLWLAGPAMLVLAGGVAFTYLRGRVPSAETGLSAEEEKQLAEILKD